MLGRAPDRPRVGLDRQPVHARPALAGRSTGRSRSGWRCGCSRSARSRVAIALRRRGAVRGDCRASVAGAVVAGAARARPRRRSIRCSATAPVVEQLGPFGYPRLRHLELRAHDVAASAGDGRAAGRRGAWLRERAPLRAGGAAVRRRARQEPDRRPGRVAAGFRRRLRRRAARTVMPHLRQWTARQPALHQRHRSDQRRAHLGRRVHDDDVAAAARSRRRRVPVSRQPLRRAAARADRARLRHAVGGRVRAGILEPRR